SRSSTTIPLTSPLPNGKLTRSPTLNSGSGSRGCFFLAIRMPSLPGVDTRNRTDVFPHDVIHRAGKQAARPAPFPHRLQPQCCRPAEPDRVQILMHNRVPPLIHAVQHLPPLV